MYLAVPWAHSLLGLQQQGQGRAESQLGASFPQGRGSCLSLTSLPP